MPPPADYILGPNDTIDVTVPGLIPDAEVRPIRVRVMADGTVTLPVVGRVQVNGLNLSAAQQAIDKAYADGVLVNPRVSVSLAEKELISVAVIGEVRSPGVYELPKFRNDIAHAVAMSGGMNEFAAEVVEVHRRMPLEKLPPQMAPEFEHEFPLELQPEFPPESIPPQSRLWWDHFPRSENDDTDVDSAIRLAGLSQEQPRTAETKVILRIPLRGMQPTIASGNSLIDRPELTREDVQLRAGDVVVVPRQQDEVFFVVGPLNRTNVVNFRVQERDRQLGNAFLLPPDRDIDVVTAVAMAGYIDPIDSPSTVTVHRSSPIGPPLLVHVDLIKARYDWEENIYVEPGDIIYLNPDAAWWFRRTFDRVLPELITAPYSEAMGLWINPFDRN